MSVTTTYTCDRCGAQQSTPEQFWTIGVVAKHDLHTAFPKWELPLERNRMQVCRACCEAMGMVPRMVPVENPPPPPTLEDLIRELIREEMQNQ